MSRQLAECAELVVQLYPTEEGGRLLPLKFASFLYNLHLKASLGCEANLVEWVGGSAEIKPGERGVIQVVFRDLQIPEFNLQVGCQVYVFEGAALIAEAELTRQWQTETVQNRSNWNPSVDEVFAWACDENAWLSDQDEDLILSHTKYRSVLTALLSDKRCADNKREEILKILSG